MRVFLFGVSIVLFCFSSCGKKFDFTSFDDEVVENYNSITEDISVMEELISLDAIDDTIIIAQFESQGIVLQNKLDDAISKIQEKDVPEDVEVYKQSVVSVFSKFKELVNHNLYFLSFNEETSEYIIDSFAIKHDKMNYKIQLAIDSFHQVRDNMLDKLKSEEQN